MAGTAIFGATASSNSMIFQAGSATATISDVGNDGKAKGIADVILLNVTVQVTRNLQPIPTLTSGILWSAQPVDGTLEAGAIITKSSELMNSLVGEGACKKKDLKVKMNDAKCSGSEGVELHIKDGYCSQVSFTMSGDRGYVGGSFVVRFTYCEVSDATDGKKKATTP